MTLCPLSSTSGLKVATFTVERMVKPDRHADVQTSIWFFCDASDCEVVYFTAAGKTLLRGDLTVRVGIKEAQAPRVVCYCFDHSIESIHSELEGTGTSTVVDSITARIRAGECSCESLNPKGRCCLGDVRKVVDQALAATAAGDGPTSEENSRTESDCSLEGDDDECDR